MFDRFTDRAKKTLSLAREAAIHARHERIGAAHVVVGLLQEGTGVAVHVLAQLGVELADLESALAAAMTPGDAPPDRGQVPFTHGAKRLLEGALAAASELQHGYVGTEHLLLGALRCGEPEVIDALRHHGVEPDAFRAGVLEFLGDSGPRGAAPDARRATLPQRHRVALLPGSAVVIAPRGEPYDRLCETVIDPALRAAGSVHLRRCPIGSASTHEAQEDELQELLLAMHRAGVVVLVPADVVTAAYLLGTCDGLLHAPIVLLERATAAVITAALPGRAVLEYDAGAVDAAAAGLRERITARAREHIAATARQRRRGG